jgi:O-antigen ligase
MVMPDSVGRTEALVRRALAAAVAVLLLWVPLPFGSVVPWSHAVLQVATFLLLALAAALVRDLGASRRAGLPAAALAAVALLGLLQSLQWPQAIVRTISPEHARLQAQAAALVGGVDGAPAVASTLSLAPPVSRAAALTWAAIAACLLVAAVAGASRSERRLIGAALVLSGLFQVFYGAQRLAAREPTIWGVEAPGDLTRLRGTFVNSDHLALYLELALPVVFALGWWAARRARDETALERRTLLVAVPVLLWLTLFVGVAFSGSRAGLAAAAAGAIAQGGLLAARRRRWRFGAAGVVAVAVGLGAVGVIGLQQGLGRWLGTSQYELTWNERLVVYRATAALWRHFPLTGTGLATFREASPTVVPREASESWYWHAHNDYLEVLATTGVVGAGLLLVAALFVVHRLGRAALHATRSEDRAAGLAALGAVAGVAVHSLFDFGLSLPANAATLAIVCGAALAVRVERARTVTTPPG